MRSHEPDEVSNRAPNFAHTTILTVRHEGHVVIAGDGQVSVGQTIMKTKAQESSPAAQ